MERGDPERARGLAAGLLEPPPNSSWKRLVWGTGVRIIDLAARRGREPARLDVAVLRFLTAAGSAFLVASAFGAGFGAESSTAAGLAAEGTDDGVEDGGSVRAIGGAISSVSLTAGGEGGSAASGTATLAEGSSTCSIAALGATAVASAFGAGFGGESLTAAGLAAEGTDDGVEDGGSARAIGGVISSVSLTAGGEGGSAASGTATLAEGFSTCSIAALGATPVSVGVLSDSVLGIAGAGTATLASSSGGTGGSGESLASGIDAVVSGSFCGALRTASAEAGSTSTSIAGDAACRVAPGTGKVINIGRSAATQTTCTAPATSTQRGRVSERLSVKVVSGFEGALAHAFALKNPLN